LTFNYSNCISPDLYYTKFAEDIGFYKLPENGGTETRIR